MLPLLVDGNQIISFTVSSKHPAEAGPAVGRVDTKEMLGHVVAQL